MKRALIVVPTYNEVEALPPLISSIQAMLASPPTVIPGVEVQVLVVDDSSPDGTGEWATRRSGETEWLHVLIRPQKDGLGNAYREAFRWAGDKGFDYLIQMDADGSHDPAEVPRLLKRIQMPDHPALVIASRQVPGSTQDWPLTRRALSALGNLYIRAVLGSAVKDSTAGYRAYDLHQVISGGDLLAQSRADGYGFQAEMTALCNMGERTVVEVSTHFSSRIAGSSKMSAQIAWEELCLINSLAATSLLKRIKNTPHLFQRFIVVANRNRRTVNQGGAKQTRAQVKCNVPKGLDQPFR